MKEEGLKENTGLWMRLLGFALIPVSVQAIQPVIGTYLSILTPLPLAYGTARRGYLEGTAAAGFIALVSFLFLGAGYGSYFLCTILPMMYGIGWVAKSRAPLYQTVAVVAGIVAMTTLAVILMYGLLTGSGITGLYDEMSQESILLMDSIKNTMDLSPEEQLEFSWSVQTSLRVFFGSALSLTILLVTFYALIIRRWLVSANILTEDGLAVLSQWKLPFWFVWIFAALASTWILTDGLLKDVMLNALFPVGTLYGIQGVVIVGHFFTRWALSPFIRFMIIFFSIIYYQQVLMILVVLTGLFDYWINFRERWPVEMTPSPPQA